MYGRRDGFGRGKSFCSYACTYAAWPRTTFTKLPWCWVWFFNCDFCGEIFAARRPTTHSCRRRACLSAQSSAATMRRYYSDPAFRDTVISKAQNRRVALLGIPGITQPAQLVDYLLRRDDGVCGLCRELVREDRGPWGPSIGHIIPLARGGLHVLSNLRLEHLTCNCSKGSRLDEELE